MKHRIIIVLILAFSLLVVPTSAVNLSESDSYINQETEIDKLFAQMNSICAEVALYRQISQSMGYSRASIVLTESVFQTRINELTSSLESLGVTRIDPNDEQAVEQLKKSWIVQWITNMRLGIR